MMCVIVMIIFRQELRNSTGGKGCHDEEGRMPKVKGGERTERKTRDLTEGFMQ